MDADLFDISRLPLTSLYLTLFLSYPFASLPPQPSGTFTYPYPHPSHFHTTIDQRVTSSIHLKSPHKNTLIEH